MASGMASSNVGLHELEYATFPFSENGGNLIWERISPETPPELLLASGVNPGAARMRGEEVQAIGLSEYLTPYERGILVLPGTHSKHLTYELDNFISLRNYMTGELFEVLLKNSILANSVIPGPFTESGKAAFLEGMDRGIDAGLGGSLLAVRARHLLYNCDKEDNYYFLSGLLMGEELAYLKNERSMVFLAAPRPVSELYKLALENIVAKNRLVFFDEKALERSVLVGQRKILALILG